MQIDDINEQQKTLTCRLQENGASLVGFGDVSFLGTELTKIFPIAISLGIKYKERIVDDLHIDEESFHNHLVSLNIPLEHLMSIAEALLTEWGYQHAVIPIAVPIMSNKQLQELRTFPHKTAATCAGLGWIGKCALLVTPEYGPRIKLGTVLTDAPFQTAEPIAKDRCGECSLCVDACPYGAVRNANWERGMSRDKLLDAYLCNEKRLEYISIIGRKHACGLCLQACRVGMSWQESKEGNFQNRENK